MNIEEEMNEKCDHDPCHCVPTPEFAVAEGKSVYCSDGCRQGIGCNHKDCDCAKAGAGLNG